MRMYCWVGVAWVVAGLAGPGAAQAVLEGRVQLPRSHVAPVMNKRYEIVTKGGVLAPSPPVAVVYLEGPFPRPANTPVAQVVQKDFLLLLVLLDPVEQLVQQEQLL